MSELQSDQVIIRVFRGSDEDQYEAYVQFYDSTGLVLSTKHHCVQDSSLGEVYSEDKQVLDLEAFYFYEWNLVGRIECHSDIQELCLSSKLRPKVGTIEFLDERRKDMIERGRFSFIDEDDMVTQYDISKFFSKMNWKKPELPVRNCNFNLFDLANFPVSIESNFKDKDPYTATVRFFDSVGNLIDLSEYATQKEYENEVVFEDWTTIDLGAFLKKEWANVAVVEARSDLTALDRFRHVKGNIDYLIYCKANMYKKLPEYLYKRIQTKKLEEFLKDIMVAP